jgi:hypothetical protein
MGMGKMQSSKSDSKNIRPITPEEIEKVIK